MFVSEIVWIRKKYESRELRVETKEDPQKSEFSVVRARQSVHSVVEDITIIELIYSPEGNFMLIVVCALLFLSVAPHHVRSCNR